MHEEGFKKIPTGSLPMPTASVSAILGANVFFPLVTTLPDSKKTASMLGKKPRYHLPGMENLTSSLVSEDFEDNPKVSLLTDNYLTIKPHQATKAATMSLTEQMMYTASMKAIERSKNPLHTIPISTSWTAPLSSISHTTSFLPITSPSQNCISTLPTPILQKIAPLLSSYSGITAQPEISSMPSYTFSSIKPAFHKKKQYRLTNSFPYDDGFLDRDPLLLEDPIDLIKAKSGFHSMSLMQSNLNRSSLALSEINLIALNKKLKKSLPIYTNVPKSESEPENPEPVTEPESKTTASAPPSENLILESASKTQSATPTPIIQNPTTAEKEFKDFPPLFDITMQWLKTKSTYKTETINSPARSILSSQQSLFFSYHLTNNNNQDNENQDEKKDIQQDQIIACFKDQMIRLASNDSLLIELNLEQVEINLEYMQEIVNSLKKNHILKKLILNQNLTDECLTLLAEALQINTTLLELSLGNGIISWVAAIRKIRACIYRNNLLAQPEITTKQLKKIDLAHLEEQDLKLILDKHPLQELDFSRQNLDISSIAHFSVLTHFSFIGVLKLNTNNLNDDAIQLLSRFLETHPTLSHLHLAYNQITEAGAEDLLKATRNIPQLKTLDLSHNLMYVIPIIFKRMEQQLNIRSEEKDSKTAKLTINVSQNYFTDECDALLYKHSFFYSVGTYREPNRINRAPGLSLILKERKIDYDNYFVFLLRKNGQDQHSRGDTQHAMILVEGVYENGQKFIHMYDFRPDLSHPGLGIVSDKAYIPHMLFAQVYGYDYVCYPAKRVKFMSLRNNIEMDKTKNLHYKKLSTGVTSISSCSRTYNCLTWAIAKLNESIMPQDEKILEPAFLPIPSLYLRGQRVIYTNAQKEEMRDEDADQSSPKRECRLM